MESSTTQGTSNASMILLATVVLPDALPPQRPAADEMMVKGHKQVLLRNRSATQLLMLHKSHLADAAAQMLTDSKKYPIKPTST